MNSKSTTLAVLIITFNEELTISSSLHSIRRHFGDIPVLVLDSYSTDETCAIANEYKARIARRTFDGYASQRQYGLGLLIDCDWVLMLDADEEVTCEFATEVTAFVRTAADGVHMALFRRRDYFLGKWIRRASGYPTWFGRLGRPSKLTVRREINEEYDCPGDKAYLSSHINHYPFAKGLSNWVERHNKYSTAEARVLASNPGQAVPMLQAFSRDPVRSRMARKSAYIRLPFRPIIGFLFLYLWRRGFMDGRAGFDYCVLRFLYECLINLKMREIVFKARQG